MFNCGIVDLTAKVPQLDQKVWYGNVKSLFSHFLTNQYIRWFKGGIWGSLYTDAVKKAVKREPLEFTATVSRDDQQNWYGQLPGKI